MLCWASWNWVLKVDSKTCFSMEASVTASSEFLAASAAVVLNISTSEVRVWTIWANCDTSAARSSAVAEAAEAVCSASCTAEWSCSTWEAKLSAFFSAASFSATCRRTSCCSSRLLDISSRTEVSCCCEALEDSSLSCCSSLLSLSTSFAELARKVSISVSLSWRAASNVATRTPASASVSRRLRSSFTSWACCSLSAFSCVSSAPSCVAWPSFSATCACNCCSTAFRCCSSASRAATLA
mmetsp:Transcript_69062/g.165677  ORF Transcript_69062/g.165677 Transcript_69062/m.165677 type:complete len:240 (-) Transcript_69062:1131-1850(-)